MNQITTQLDRIIARLKQNEKLAKVKFIREHGNHGAEINLTSFLAVVAVTDTVLSKKYVGDYLSASVKGEQFLAKVQIFVYAPADENGNGLSEITCEIMQGLKKADTEKIISELLVSAIDFDTDTVLSKKYVGDYLSASVKGEQFLAKVQIFVYAPADENGNGLSEITCEIMQGLKKADTEKIISELLVSAIDFDTDINAIFRKVEFTMEFFVCEEV